jgi:hypothetical protein
MTHSPPYPGKYIYTLLSSRALPLDDPLWMTLLWMTLLWMTPCAVRGVGWGVPAGAAGGGGGGGGGEGAAGTI